MKLWIAFVIGAGLCWGTYVPLIAFGGKSLAAQPQGIGNRLAAILCVGGAYLLIAVLIPLVIFFLNGTSNLKWTNHGIFFSSLAGVAGALGAVCVVFATANATPADRLYIAPVIFSLAPIINTLCSLFWHPTSENAWHFDWPKAPPGTLFYVGILLAAAGTFLVLYSKEASEAPVVKPQAAQAASTSAPSS
jgi:predicted membrane channel-forming protein YqfA (hemolysin III family)